MNTLTTQDKITVVLLRLGMANPLLYFGIQIIAAPFYPNYSFLRNVASELGSNRSPYPGLFNAGIILLGIVTILASSGFLRALLRLGTNRLLAWLVAVSVALNGIQSLWAGSFPLPDPRHGGHPAFILGMISLPLLLAAVLWKQPHTTILKAYVLVGIMIIVTLIPFMSGMAGVDTRSFQGLLQRAFALTIFPPIGISAYLLARCLKWQYSQ